MVEDLQGLRGVSATIEAVKNLTGIQYSLEKSRTVGRYVASLVNAGDNHITLLTAAYCVLFDRVWWYVP